MFLRSKIQEMILRKRSRSMSSSSSSSSSSSKHNHIPHLSSPAIDANSKSQRLFFLASNSFTKYPNLHCDSSSSMSPTSILDTTTPFSPSAHPFFPDSMASPHESKRRAWHDDIALGLVDALHCDSNDKKNVLGLQLRVQIPSVSVDCHGMSPVEFGVKNKNSWFSLNADASPEEMELSSEDYTCVISRGPNPRTRHIFGNRIVECCCNDGCLSLCHSCKKDLDHEKDMFMDSSERSHGYRYNEMAPDLELHKCLTSFEDIP